MHLLEVPSDSFSNVIAKTLARSGYDASGRLIGLCGLLMSQIIRFSPEKRNAQPTVEFLGEDSFMRRVRHIELFYNAKGRHVRNGMLSHVEFEKRQKNLTRGCLGNSRQFRVVIDDEAQASFMQFSPAGKRTH